MSKKKKGFIQIWKPIEKVELIKEKSGSGVYSVKGFTLGRHYDVNGVYVKTFSDRETEPCYILKDDNGILRTVVFEKFRVIA